ncbi:MAG: hypothetical protein WAZ60_23895 [Desulfosalsimonadaceae bacterium]
MMNKKLELEYIKKMKDADSGDTEQAHGQADDLLCELLVKIGYSQVIDEYNKIDKWYA